MVDGVKMSGDVKRRLILGVGFVCVVVFLFMVFVAGAGYSCYNSGGVLLKNVNGMRCVVVESVDLCRDYRGVIIEKPENFFNTSFNMSAYNFSPGD